MLTNLFQGLCSLYKLTKQFIAISLSRLVNNLSEGIHKIKCKRGHDDEKCETCGINTKIATTFLNISWLQFGLLLSMSVIEWSVLRGNVN